MLCNTSANTLLYRKLEENAQDSSGNGRHGTVVGSPTFSSTNGAYFKPSTSGNRIEFPSNFYPGTQFTISLWCKRFDTTKEFRAFSDWGTNYRRLLFGLQPNSAVNILFGNQNNQQSDWASVTTYDTAWHNRILVKDGYKATLYKDGQLIGTHTFTYNPQPGGLSVGEYCIGNIGTSTTYMSEDYAKYYIIENVLWSGQDAQKYYNKTKNKFLN